eukprot:gene23926-9495_t
MEGCSLVLSEVDALKEKASKAFALGQFQESVLHLTAAIKLASCGLPSNCCTDPHPLVAPAPHLVPNPDLQISHQAISDPDPASNPGISQILSLPDPDPISAVPQDHRVASDPGLDPDHGMLRIRSGPDPDQNHVIPQNHCLASNPDLDPDHVISHHTLSVLYSNRSAAHLMQNAYVQALVDSKLAIKHDGSWVKPYIRMAVAQAGLERYGEASAAVEMGIRINSSCVNTAGAVTLFTELRALQEDVDVAMRVAGAMKRRRMEAKAAEGPIAKAIAKLEVGTPKGNVPITALPGFLGAGTPKRNVPITVLSGFLGAGKTTLLKHLLSSQHGLRIGVIVNDMAAINIDAQLIRQTTDKESRDPRDPDPMSGASSRDVVELTNGCICCTLKGDLLMEVASLLAGEEGDKSVTRPLDYILIESTGVGEPLPVAAAFSMQDELGRSLQGYVTVDTMVTVVDASTFQAEYNCALMPSQRGDPGSVDADDDVKPLGELSSTKSELTADAQPVSETKPGCTADVLPSSSIADGCNADVLPSSGAKADWDFSSMGEAVAAVKALNPDAKVVGAVRCEVAPKEMMGTGLFHLEKAELSAKWKQEVAESWDMKGGGSGGDPYASDMQGGVPGGAVHAADNLEGGPGGAADLDDTLKQGSRENTSLEAIAHVPETGLGDYDKQGSRKRAHVPETELYDIHSFTFVARRPFHPLRLHALLHPQPNSLATHGLPSSDQLPPICRHSKAASEQLPPPGRDSEAASEQFPPPGRDSVTASEQLLSLSRDSKAASEQRPSSSRGSEAASEQLPSPSSLRVEVYSQLPPQLLRSKGFFWIAGLPDVVLEWSTTGARCQHFQVYGNMTAVGTDGLKACEPRLRKTLEACLLTDDEVLLGADAWDAWENPWRDSVLH